MSLVVTRKENFKVENIVAEEVSLQNKYLYSESMQSKLLLGFIHALDRNAAGVDMQKTSEGSTGFTFLCAVPSKEVEGETLNTPIRFVLKWQKDTQNKVEILGSKLFQFLGYPAPIPQPVFLSEIPTKKGSRPTTIVHLLTEKANTRAPSLRPGILSPIVMPRIHARNFNAWIESGDLLRLSAKNKKRLYREIGKIAVGDLLIGNDDRTFSLSYDTSRKLQDQTIVFNSGNILIGQTEKKVIVVYPIDNCPSHKLIERKRDSLGDVEGLPCLFDGEKSEEETKCNSENSRISDESPSCDEVRGELQKTFHLYIQNLPKLSFLIHRGIQGAMDRAKQPTPLIPPSKAKQQLQKGMRAAISRIASNHSTLPEPEMPMDKNALRLKTLFEENLSMLKKINNGQKS